MVLIVLICLDYYDLFHFEGHFEYAQGRTHFGCPTLACDATLAHATLDKKEEPYLYFLDYFLKLDCFGLYRILALTNLISQVNQTNCVS